MKTMFSILVVIVVCTSVSITGCGLINELLEPSDISLLVKDTVPPVISLTSHTNNQPVGGIFTLEGAASDVGQGINKIYVKVGTNDWKIASLSGKYWSYDVSAGTNLMPHTIFIYAEDKANNYSRTITNTVVRVAMPSLYAMYPPNGIITNMTNIWIGGMTAMDTFGSNTNIMIQINGGVWTQANNLGDWTNFSFDACFTQVTNTYRIRVYGTTPFIADSGLRTVIVDNQPPVFVSVNYANYQTVLSTPYQLQLLYQDSMIGVSNVYLKLNGGTYNPIGYSSPYWISSISENTLIAHVWKSYAMDKFNNPSYTNQTVIFRKNFTMQEFVPYLNGMPTNFSIVGGGNNIVVSGDGNTLVAPIPGYKIIRLHLNGGIWQTNIFSSIYFPTSECFGNSISISSNGNKIAIGDLDYQNGGVRVGCVYLFEYDGFTWITNLFKPTNQNYNPGFGTSIDISADGNSLLIGSPYDGEIEIWAGAVYVFQKNGSVWETNKFTIPDGNDSDRFGTSVSLASDGNTFIAGSYVGGSGGAQKVYYFHSTNDNWEVTNVFSQGLYFGYKVAISDDGDSFIVDVYNLLTSYYYHWNGSSWDPTAIIPHAYATANSGNTLAISSDGNTLVFSDVYSYRYHWNGSVWTTNIIFAYDPSMKNFGQGVVCSPDGKTVWVKGDKIYKFTSEW